MFKPIEELDDRISIQETHKGACGHLIVSGPISSQRVALLDVSSLEQVWPCWRKWATVGAGFEVFDAQATPSVTVHFLLPNNQDVASTMSAYVPPCSLP